MQIRSSGLSDVAWHMSGYSSVGSEVGNSGVQGGADHQVASLKGLPEPVVAASVASAMTGS